MAATNTGVGFNPYRKANGEFASADEVGENFEAEISVLEAAGDSESADALQKEYDTYVMTNAPESEKGKQLLANQYGLNATAKKESETYDPSTVEYGGINEVPTHIEANNDTSGARDTKEVKRNEKLAIAQAKKEYGVKVAKRRKSEANNGYRDTTLYSPDDKRFVTIRANEDDPGKSYVVSGEKGKPSTANSLYDAGWEVSSLNRYSGDVVAASKGDNENTATVANTQPAQQKRYKSAEELQGKISEAAGTGVSVSENLNNGQRWTTARFYDGSVIGVKKDTNGIKPPKFAYIDKNGNVTDKGELDSAKSAQIEQDVKRKAFDSKSSAEFDQSVQEIEATVSSDPKYHGFKVHAYDDAFQENERGDYQRDVIIRGETGGVAFIQYSTQENLEGEPETLYDVMSTENLDDGGIFMKNDPSRSDYTGKEMKRFLDALKAKDDAGDTDGSLYSYLKK